MLFLIEVDMSIMEELKPLAEAAREGGLKF